MKLQITLHGIHRDFEEWLATRAGDRHAPVNTMFAAFTARHNEFTRSLSVLRDAPTDSDFAELFITARTGTFDEGSQIVHDGYVDRLSLSIPAVLYRFDDPTDGPVVLVLRGHDGERNFDAPGVIYHDLADAHRWTDLGTALLTCPAGHTWRIRDTGYHSVDADGREAPAKASGRDTFRFFHSSINCLAHGQTCVLSTDEPSAR